MGMAYLGKSKDVEIDGLNVGNSVYRLCQGFVSYSRQCISNSDVS